MLCLQKSRQAAATERALADENVRPSFDGFAGGRVEGNKDRLRKYPQAYATTIDLRMHVFTD